MELIVRLRRSGERVQVDRDGEPLSGARSAIAATASTRRAPGSISTLLIDGRQHEVAVRQQQRGSYRVSSTDWHADVEVIDPLTHLARQSRGSQDGSRPGEVTAYMPGRVVTVLVAEGETVDVGQGLVVLEAMKMENEIQAPHQATIKRLRVQAGQTVEAGDVLVELA